MSYIGTTEIGKMFLGDVEIDKAYLGNTLVFEGTIDTSPGADGKLWAYYITTNNNQSVTLTNSGVTGIGDTMEVDGVSVSFASTYTFAEAGTHLVKFTCGTTSPANIFYSIAGPREVYFPKNITTVGGSSFRSNSGVYKVVIPSKVTTIATRAFQRASALRILVCKATTPPTCATSTSIYDLNSALKIYVPYSEDHSVLAAYKAATRWSNYANYMHELNPDGTIPE